MSTFSGLSLALSSLMAQRQALNVTGQNIANANTIGYTRQRASLTAVEALSNPSMFSVSRVAGNGVQVSGIDRLGDIFLDTRLRAETSTTGYLDARSQIYAQLESNVPEPGDSGIARQLQNFWASWMDVSNRPDDIASRRVTLEAASSLAERLAAGYQAVSTQWEQVHAQSTAMVAEVNVAAAAVADLNDRISTITSGGGSANELMDQRDQLIVRLSELTGAGARYRDDGTIDVMVGGNALVRGARSFEVTLTGPHTLAGAELDRARLVWANGGEIGVEGGRLAGNLSALAGADGAGTGGVLAEAAASYNALAQNIASSVNAIHQAGTTLGPPPATGTDFFTLTAGVPPALGLTTITDPTALAAGDGAGGPLDGSIADAIAQLATDPGGPDRQWSAFVVDLGVSVASARHRAGVAEAARATAEQLQLSTSSVDLDEESVNMLAYQRAYEGAARVLTVIDEMLDVLINRTGVVGR